MARWKLLLIIALSFFAGQLYFFMFKYMELSLKLYLLKS